MTLSWRAQLAHGRDLVEVADARIITALRGQDMVGYAQGLVDRAAGERVVADAWELAGGPCGQANATFWRGAAAEDTARAAVTVQEIDRAGVERLWGRGRAA